MTLSAGTIAIEVTFDVDQRGSQTWDIVIETDGGTLTLSAGASKMAVDGAAVTVTDDPEYARLYRRFHHLVTTRTSDVDFSPFRLVADAFMLARRETVDAFAWASCSSRSEGRRVGKGGVGTCRSRWSP